MRAGLLSLAAATASRAAKAAPSSSSSSAAKKSSKPSVSSSKTAVTPPAKQPPPAVRAKPPPSKVCSLSPGLAKLLDVNEATRPDALKRVWAYIKAQRLQNQLDKKEILCDEKLKALFGQEKVTISEVLKYLSPHIMKKD